VNATLKGDDLEEQEQEKFLVHARDDANTDFE